MGLRDRSQPSDVRPTDDVRPGGGDSPRVLRAVRAFQAGVEREESFRVLFEIYGAAVEGYFRRRLANPEACRDLTQETFLKVYRGLEGFRGDAPFGAWLFRIARNLLHDRRGGTAAARQRRREVSFEEVEMAVRTAEAKAGRSVPPPALTSVLRDEERRVLRQAIDRLPPQRRRCIVLWAYHDLSYEQIAVVMGLALGTVKAHLAQARQQLDGLVAEVGRETRP